MEGGGAVGEWCAATFWSRSFWDGIVTAGGVGVQGPTCINVVVGVGGVIGVVLGGRGAKESLLAGVVGGHLLHLCQPSW